jgi:hypothetical protein
MKASRSRLGVAAAALVMSACASGPQPLYQWGRYDESLYAHYKKPQNRTDFVANLKKVVLESEKAGKKVPPGCYAEYGYVLLEEGQKDQAIAYFGKERDLWPESRELMEKMIRNAQRIGPQSPDQTQKPTGEAGAVEGT